MLKHLTPLQQYLPFTVLKLSIRYCFFMIVFSSLQQYLPFTVLKLSEIETNISCFYSKVATVLTVYGIETLFLSTNKIGSATLQQYLPFTVLKRATAVVVNEAKLTCCNSTYRLRY